MRKGEPGPRVRAEKAGNGGASEARGGGAVQGHRSHGLWEYWGFGE